MHPCTRHIQCIILPFDWPSFFFIILIHTYIPWWKIEMFYKILIKKISRVGIVTLLNCWFYCFTVVQWPGRPKRLQFPFLFPTWRELHPSTPYVLWNCCRKRMLGLPWGAWEKPAVGKSGWPLPHFTSLMMTIRYTYTSCLYACVYAHS